LRIIGGEAAAAAAENDRESFIKVNAKSTNYI